ncbi:VENOM COMPONENT: C-type lectin-snaclec-subunit-beta 3 like [Crotalus adamanteus]|uniref:VENOM COMPONENT: C-type lectin-snaclec-subunit-beta 3 like n=1 Tax=Crotalus adamanteus TaxID=8729 RepID=A0AAW1BDN4_CROAD
MGRFIFVSFGLLVVFLSLSGTAADCPPGWSSYEGHCYKPFNEAKNWADAENFCTQQHTGGHLVSFHSTEETDFVGKLAFQTFGQSIFWIGLSNVWNDFVSCSVGFSALGRSSVVYKGGGGNSLELSSAPGDFVKRKKCSWQWSNGAMLKYEDWAEESYCVYFKSTNNKWRSRSCRMLAHFVCEFQA